MTFEELENIERNNADKLEIFRGGEIEKCEGITIGQLKNLVMEYLSDEQKEEMLLMQKYNFSTIFVGNVISSILDNDIKTRLLFDDSITKEIATFDLLKIIKSLNDDSKLKILHNIDFLKSKNFKSYDIKNVISSLNEESRAEILDDP